MKRAGKAGRARQGEFVVFGPSNPESRFSCKSRPSRSHFTPHVKKRFTHRQFVLQPSHGLARFVTEQYLTAITGICAISPTMRTRSLYNLFTESVVEQNRDPHEKLQLIDNAGQYGITRIWHTACLRTCDESVHPCTCALMVS